MDVVGLPLDEAINELQMNRIKYVISLTCPVKKQLCLDTEKKYIIRQKIDDEGVYYLMTAAKMGKEVL